MSVPYYHQSVNWPKLMSEHPPPPIFGTTVGVMSDAEIEKHQNVLLAPILEAAWNTPFFTERWSRAGLGKGDVTSLEDLTKLPIYTSDDLKESIVGSPPFGAHFPLIQQPLGSLPLKLQTSGGTTGLPRPSIFDPVAWEVQAIQGARGMWAAGFRPGDIAQIPYTCSLANAGWAFQKSCHDWLGVMPVTTGSGVVTPSERQLELALAFGVNVWVAGSEYLGRLVEVAEATGFDLGQLHTKVLRTYMGNDPNDDRRRVLEEAFGAPAYEGYGTHEVGEMAFECTHRQGMHISEDTVFLEVIDLDDGQLLGPGEFGSLVATSLHRTWPPIVRYNLRDIVAIYPRAECECGLRTIKVSQLQARADEMIKVRETNVYPRAVDALVAADPRTTGEYICVVTRSDKGILGTTEITFRVERRSQDPSEDNVLQAELADAFKAALTVRVGVEIVEPKSLAPLTGYDTGEKKIKRLLDLRDTKGKI
jgi:phenylacetate-CoA ligase